MIGSDEFSRVHLAIAGGFDDLVSENAEYLSELRSAANKLHLSDHVTFLCNVSASDKHSLLVTSSCLLYTPDNEHFGIVPLEAMHAGCPVLAVDSGGPRETVVDGVTGFLRRPSASEFAEAMRQFVGSDGDELKRRMGEAATERVRRCFSFDSFTVQLNRIVSNLCSSTSSN